MHELAVTESLLKTACEYAEKNNAHHVISLNLVIGDLSGIIDDSVQFYWDIISENTLCSKAKLIIQRKPAKLYCQSCGNTFLLESELEPCPRCTSLQLKVLSGDEFLLESIEIEKMEDEK